MRPLPKALLGLASATLALLAATSAQAIIELEVEPMIAEAGQPVLIFGAADCETYTVNPGDGTPAMAFNGPSTFSFTHVYTTPGIYQVLVLGSGCIDGIDNQVSTVVVNPGTGGPGDPGDPQDPPAGTPIGSLVIERMRLHFANGRPETRVLQNQKGVQVFAELQYRGTGLLQGYWEVDGAAWSFVNRHLVFGSTTTLASPELPGLPTVEPGLHRVRFVLLRPVPAGFTAPLALYFAGYEEAPPTVQLTLMRPVAAARLRYGLELFTWAATEGADHYAVQFFDADTDELVFSAFTRDREYALVERVLEQRFAPGRRYRWQVTALDAEGEELSRSIRRTFELDGDTLAGAAAD